MASKGMRAISYHCTRKVEAGYKPSHTTETLIGYIVCWQLGFIHLLLLNPCYLASNQIYH